jgi:hypothetical protein
MEILKRRSHLEELAVDRISKLILQKILGKFELDLFGSRKASCKHSNIP